MNAYVLMKHTPDAGVEVVLVTDSEKTALDKRRTKMRTNTNWRVTDEGWTTRSERYADQWYPYYTVVMKEVV